MQQNKVIMKKEGSEYSSATCPYCGHENLFDDRIDERLGTDKDRFVCEDPCKHLVGIKNSGIAKFEGEQEVEETVMMLDENDDLVTDISDAKKVVKQKWKGGELLDEEWGTPAENTED